MRVQLAIALLICSSCEHAPPQVVDPAERLSLRLLVQPLGNVPRAHLDSVAAELAAQHRAVVFIAPAVELPRAAYTALRTPRYRADTLIAWLRSMKPDTIDHIIGITTQDISITKYAEDGSIKEPSSKYREFGIFGLGYIGGPSCVVSMHRLGDGKSARFFDRLKKIAVHEVGHNRWLPHCADTSCVMRDAVERIASIDGAGRSLCAACANRSAQRR